MKILGTLSNLQATAPSYDNQLDNWWFHVPLPILTFPFDPGERGHNRGLAFARKAVVRTQLLSGIGALIVKIREAWHHQPEPNSQEAGPVRGETLSDTEAHDACTSQRGSRVAANSKP